MTPTDAGPLVALVDLRDQHHAEAVRVADRLPDDPMVTSWPCFTEAMHLLRRSTGRTGQEALWSMVTDGDLVIRDPTPGETDRMAELMRTYANVPMDLADASMVAAAEATGVRELFTFDNDFRIYVLRDGTVLDVVP